MSDVDRLRPLERCVLRLSADGVPDAEIGRRLRRSPDFVRRVRALTHVPRSVPPDRQQLLRPLERCVMRWREQGEGYAEVAARFHRSPAFIEFVEELADYKLSR